MLPRLLNEGTKTKGELHKLIQARADPWHPKQALKGQNDFVDILGDGSVHPVRLLTNVPKWIRGFQGTGDKEIQMLNRKWRAHKDWKETRPRAWTEMKQRIDYLYAFLNLRRRPPPYEDY
jgi:large subunit ribosomal protein L51